MNDARIKVYHTVVTTTTKVVTSSPTHLRDRGQTQPQTLGAYDSGGRSRARSLPCVGKCGETSPASFCTSTMANIAEPRRCHGPELISFRDGFTVYVKFVNWDWAKGTGKESQNKTQMSVIILQQAKKEHPHEKLRPVRYGFLNALHSTDELQKSVIEFDYFPLEAQLLLCNRMFFFDRRGWAWKRTERGSLWLRFSKIIATAANAYTLSRLYHWLK